MVNVRDAVGYSSAATLGFIHGNFRGAKSAVAAYGTYRNMPPFRTPRRSRTLNPYPTPQSNRRRQTINPYRRTVRTRSVSSTPRIARFARTKGTPQDTVQKPDKRKGNKVHKEGIKKRVKIPRKLRKQVKQILETKGPTGTLLDIKTTVLPIADGQQIGVFGTVSENNPVTFDPAWIQYVASVLFNGAATTQTPLIGNANYFSPRTLRVDVIKQSVTYRFRNNTGRTITMKILDMSPKSRNFGNGFNPLTFWTNQFQQEGTANAPNNPNVFNINPRTLYAHPKMSEAWTNLYETDETIVNLEAGREYVHKVSGPNMKLYDFQKFWSGSAPTAGVFDNQQKFVKQTMVIYYPDLTGTVNATYGRFTDLVAPTPFGMIVEQTTYTKIHMPEQAGFSWPAVTPVVGNQPLNKRMRVYAISDWTSVQSGAVQQVEDENPQAPATVAV